MEHRIKKIESDRSSKTIRFESRVYLSMAVAKDKILHNTQKILNSHTILHVPPWPPHHH